MPPSSIYPLADFTAPEAERAKLILAEAFPKEDGSETFRHATLEACATFRELNALSPAWSAFLAGDFPHTLEPSSCPPTAVPAPAVSTTAPPPTPAAPAAPIPLPPKDTAPTTTA